MKKTLCMFGLIALAGSVLFGQTGNGTLKIFSEEPVIVYVDQVQQPSYQSILLVPGTHYVKVLNKNEEKVYSEIVTIEKDKVTSVLIEAGKTAALNQKASTEPAAKQNAPATTPTPSGTGTLNIFSELTGTVVYLNENRQGEDVRSIKDVPAGNHYLKVMKDGVSILAELVTINPGQTTTVLVKNDGQVAEKIMESKSKEREQYQSQKIDVLFSSNSVSTTQGANTLFPGFYGYYGYSSSVTNTSQVSDFKIIQGGVKEIGDIGLANLAENQDILNEYARMNSSVKKQTNVGLGMFLGALLIGGPVLVDILVDKPFLHPVGTTAPNWEIGVATGGIVAGVLGYAIVMGADKKYPRHYYQVDQAAKDAQEYNRKLKEGLGLPESYDVK